MSLKPRKGICKECGTEQYIISRTHMLCQKHNNIRLHGSEYGKQYEWNKELSEKAKEQIALDEELYEKVFNRDKYHRCKNCNTKLPSEFRDSKGKVRARWRYAHILPKSTHPEIRHEVDNVISLCLKCHTQLDQGDKFSLRIWGWIKNKIEELRKLSLKKLGR